MRKIFCFLLILSIGINSSSELFAQQFNSNIKSIHAGGSGYKTGIGLRGGLESGITLKHFIKDQTAIEGIFSRGWGYRGMRITGLIEFQRPIKGVEGLNWFFGFGAHIGFYDGGYYGYYGHVGGGYYDKHGKWHPTGYRRSYTTFGIDGILGLEYQFADLPITIGLDIKPFFDFVGPGDHYADGALSIRYVF